MDMTMFKTQHKEVGALVQSIEAQLAKGATGMNADTVRQDLSTLVGKLKIHLAMEDKSIYPKAETSANGDLKTLALKMKTEMSGLAGALISYNDKWATSAKIKENPQGFITETKGVFTALKGRVATEDTQFYPLLEKFA